MKFIFNTQLWGYIVVLLLVFVSVLSLSTQIQILAQNSAEDPAVSDFQVLAPPENFMVEYYQDQQLILLWDGGDVNTVEYEIRRAEDPENLEAYATVTARETSYIDTVEPNTTYYYQVVATAPGFIDAETNIAEIQLTPAADQLPLQPSQQNAASELNSESAAAENLAETSSQSSVLAEFTGRLGGKSDRFWWNLGALNLLGLGVLLLMFQLAKLIFDPRKSINNSSNNTAVSKNVSTNHLANLRNSLENSMFKLKSVKPKLGPKDRDIVEKANRNFLDSNADKLKEWLTSSDTESN